MFFKKRVLVVDEKLLDELRNFISLFMLESADGIGSVNDEAWVNRIT